MSTASELKEIAKELQAELKHLEIFTALNTWHRLEDIQRRLDKCCLETQNNTSVKALSIRQRIELGEAYKNANSELAEEGSCDCPAYICEYCGEDQKYINVQTIDDEDNF